MAVSFLWRGVGGVGQVQLLLLMAVVSFVWRGVGGGGQVQLLLLLAVVSSSLLGENPRGCGQVVYGHAIRLPWRLTIHV